MISNNTIEGNVPNVYEVPFKANFREAARLFFLNFKKIFFGSLLFILEHPILCWPVLIERLRCVYRGSTKVTKVPGGFSLNHTHQYYIYGNIFIERALYEKNFIEELSLAPTPVIIDVGANCGIFAQWIASWNEEATFHCFEPCKEYLAEFSRITKESSNKLFVYINQLAVSNTDGRAKLHVGSYVALSEDGREVKTMRLDTYSVVGNVFLLKIDTDGSNLKVLQGAEETLRRTRYVLIEKEIEDSCYLEFFTGWSRIDLGNDFLLENPKFQ